MCKGERDLLGKIYRGPERPLTRAFVPGRRAPARRRYALQIDWADGHNDGIYRFGRCERMGEEGERSGA